MTSGSFFASLMPAALMPVAMICVALLAAAPASAQGAARGMEVQCAAGRRFTLHVDDARATIIWTEGRLTLERRTLSLGRYYRGPTAALIIDGDYVSFVPKGDRNWRDCHFMPRTGAIENQ